MVDTKELANITSNFFCLPLPCGALICSCCGESWVWVEVHISLNLPPSRQSTDSSLIYILLSTGPNRQANNGWQSWEATLSGNCCLVCCSLVKYALCPYVAHHAQKVEQSWTFCTPRLLYSSLLCLCTISNKVFCLSAPWKKTHPDLSFSNDRKVYQMRDREKGSERERESKERKQEIEIYIEM